MKKNSKNTASTYYTNIGTISCSGCKVSKSSNACGYCGDGEVQTTNNLEECENTSVGIKYSGGTFDGKSFTESNSSYKLYEIPITGIYEITAKGARGGNGGSGGQSKNLICLGSGASGGSGAAGAAGGVVTAQYYFTKGTKLRLYAGTIGSGGGNGSKDSSTGGSGGSKGLSNSDNHDSGKSGANGNQGNGKAGGCGGSGGGGGGGGGASVVKIDADGTTLVLAYGGGGGGGGEGGGPASSGCTGSSPSTCWGASDTGSGCNDYGGRGKEGGNGGHYSDSQCSYYYPTPTGSNYKYVGGYSNSGTNSGNGSVSITLKKYMSCKNDCHFETDISKFETADYRKVPCTGLEANAEWNTASELTQYWNGSSWSNTSTTGTYSTTASTTACRYKCKSGYVRENNACIKTRVVACPMLSIPNDVHTVPSDSNWEWNTVSEIPQIYSNGSWTQADTVSYDTTPTTTACRFKCKEGYEYQETKYTYYTQSGEAIEVPGNSCRNDRTANCTGLPAHAHWTSNNGTSKTITQNWTQATGWTPSSNGSNNASTDANKCYFQCNTNYTYNESSKTCVAKTQPATCTNLPAANALWWSNGSTTAPTITQTWNENLSGCNPASNNCWEPTSVGSNQASGATNQCYFHCKTNYTYSASGNKCEANTQSANCSSKPANTSWNDSNYNHGGVAGTFTQTWNGSAWTPASYTSTYGTTAGICKFKCNTNYTWNSGTSKCDANHQAGTCGTKPDNTVWNDNGGYGGAGKFEQIWNGSAWNPASKAAVYSPNSTQACGYKCADGYHTENGGTSCVSNKKTVDCPALQTGAVANTVTSIEQNWDFSTSAWKPANTLTYNTEASTEYCRYKCGTNFNWNGTQCVGKTINGTCTGNPANSTLWSPVTIDQTWTNVNGTWQWVPSTTATYKSSAVSGECHFKCNSGYRYLNGSCKKTSWSFENDSDYPSDLVTISTSGSYPWARSTSIGGNTGSSAMCPGNHNVHSTTSTMNVTVNVPQGGGTLSFYAKGKGEGSSTYYDWFKVTVDGTQKIYTTDLSSAWTKYSYDLSAGEHTLVFDYRKDSSVSNEPDMFCVDDMNLDFKIELDKNTWGFESAMPTSGSNWIVEQSNSNWALTSSLGSGLPSPKGSKSICSTNHTDSTYADLTVKVNSAAGSTAGTLSFYYTGSSEASYDFLQVWLDPSSSDLAYDDHDSDCKGTEILCTDGSNYTSWTYFEKAIPAGEHTILFRYRKDYSTSNNADTYCIDDLTLISVE